MILQIASNTTLPMPLKRQAGDPVMVPSYRPDKATAAEDPVAWNAYIAKLSAASEQPIETYQELVAALDKRHAAFHALGCRAFPTTASSSRSPLSSPRNTASDFLQASEECGAKSGRNRRFPYRPIARSWTHERTAWLGWRSCTCPAFATLTRRCSRSLVQIPDSMP